MKLLSLGAISPYGSTLREHCENKKKQRPPRTEEMTFLLEGKNRRVKIEQCHDLSLELPVPDSVLRRSSRSAQMTLSSIEEARKYFPVESKRVGVVVGSPYGATGVGLEYIKRLVKSDFKLASPNLFAQSVHNNLASTVAITYGLKGPTMTLVQKENLWLSLLQVADQWLEDENVDFVWLVIGNEMCNHNPYIQAYEHHHKNRYDDALALHPPHGLIATESYSSFLLGPDSKFPRALSLKVEESRALLEKLSAQYDVPLEGAERVGISLAEHYLSLIEQS